MAELSSAEQQQEAWFNSSVRTANKVHEEPRHWIDSIAEDLEQAEDYDGDSSDDESDTYDEDEEMFTVPPRVTITSAELDDEEDEEDDEYLDLEFDEQHALTRVASKHSPPGLMLDSDSSDDEDESQPPSPRNSVIELSEKERQSITTTAFYDVKAQQGLEEYVIQQPQATIIAAC
jgi:hypothetical protein